MPRAGDVTVDYRKNRELDRTCDLLHKYGIYVYLSFIVDPTKVDDDRKSAWFYERLLERFCRLRPEMVCGNFLMPFRGTAIWDDYKHLVTPEDFRSYDSKSAFLEKDPLRRAKDEYDMYRYQRLYYESDFYRRKVRRFDTGDTLHMRFEELKQEFGRKWQDQGLPERPDPPAWLNG